MSNNNYRTIQFDKSGKPFTLQTQLIDESGKPVVTKIKMRADVAL